MEIEHALRKAGASSVKDLHLITDDWIPQKARQMTKRLSSQETRTKKPVVKPKSTDWLGRKRSALMVVASLIATVAFQAGLTPPGGVWQDNFTVDENGNPVSNPHSVGQSIMAYQAPRAYGIFMILNTIAFLASLSIILLLVSGLPMRRRRWIDVEGVLREVTEISVLTWLTLMVVVFMGNIVRMNLWVLRKYGYIKEKEIQTEGIDDQEDMLE
ncbi:hypothetical protein Salat_1046600 [Sesamum alatum]|uniref:PGG domain-containing protein n=1 Tax=Sesamum alatum TaxID=300844 RepID=A0AAE2CST4_9LAMI|nr:hypothetical protein Salat_1046600 [Sesamum alatum]